jgi:DhnA family fructose-bisphosphate aldolase class Ia
MDGGGKGIVMGRKVWQSPDPAATMRAIVEVVRGGADVASALRHYNASARAPR